MIFIIEPCLFFKAVHAETPPDAVKHLIIICTANCEIICNLFQQFHSGKFHAEGNYPEIVSQFIDAVGEPLPNFTSERLCLSKMLYLHPIIHKLFSQLTLLLPICSSRYFFLVPFAFCSLLSPMSQFI